MKVLMLDGRGQFIVRVDDGDVPPGMESVVIVTEDLRVSPVRRLGSVLAQMDPGEWTQETGGAPPSVMEAVQKALR